MPEFKVLANIITFNTDEEADLSIDAAAGLLQNDSDDDARELVRLLKHYKLPAKVNLIPFNPWPGAGYECSSPERIRRFSEIVFAGGISAPIRTPRGRDIDAACGQLKTAARR